MVMVKLQVLLLPPASVAFRVIVTGEEVFGSEVPAVGNCVTVTDPQLSEVVARPV